MPSKKQVKFNIQTATCGICEERNGIVSDAAAFCKTCEQFLCRDCIKPHRKLVAMDNHVLLNRDHEIKEEKLYFIENEHISYGDMITKVPVEIENTFEEYMEYRNRTMEEIERSKESAVEDTDNEGNDSDFYERCDEHSEMKIKYYCTFHEQLCCDDCKIFNHRTCHINMKYIPEQVEREQRGNAVDAFKRLISDLKEFDRYLQSDVKELKKSKQTFLFDLKAKKRELLNWMNLMEVRAIRRLEIVFDKCKKEIDQKRKNTKMACQKLRSEMFFLRGILENDTHNDIYKYVKEKKAVKTLNDIASKREHRKFTKSRFSFKLNQDFLSLKSSMDHLYEVCFETKGEDKFSVRLKDDLHTSNVTGCTFIDNGDVVLADRSNGRLKHLDMNFKTVRHMTGPGDIFDVTALGHNSVAFTSPLMSTISITELRPTLEIVKTIDTGNGSCWGVSHHDGIFAVNVTTVDSCMIKIIDIDSNELFHIDIKRHFYSTIKVDPEDPILHVITTAAYEEGKSGQLEQFVDVYESDNSCSPSLKVSMFNYLSHLRTKGIVFNNYDNLVVCCSDTDQIYTISKTGEGSELLLAESDGLCRPQALCYNSDNTKLLVTSELTDYIQIFRF